MKTIDVKGALALFTTLLLFVTGWAQVEVPFTPRLDNSYVNIKGDYTFLSNGILNRVDSSNSANDPYNGGSNNNGFHRDYIDIDGDPTTFSSSSSTLSLPFCSRIYYAGLYWSANYQQEVLNNTQISGLPQNDTQRLDFTTIKFRMPGGSYIDITADNNPDPVGEEDEIIHDDVNFKDSPYTCYRNVTGLLQSLADPNGEYFVGNVRATRGRSVGGAGGWTLVIIYENPTLTGKYISVFDGYAGVRGSSSADITVAGFNTIPVGPVRARLGASVVEGDRSITGDAFRIETPLNPGFTSLSNASNPTNNFFNSNITIDGADVTTRNIASTNTLGFDSDIFEINNPLNSIIANEETDATLRLFTQGDAFGAFLVTFGVEIIEPNIILEKKVEDIGGNDITGAGVNLGQYLDYVLSFVNTGNDDAVNYTIRDVLPVNTSFLGVDLGANTDITYTYDSTTRELVFDIPERLVEEGDPITEIRINVQVAENCFDFIDACTDQIENVAFSTYEGLINDNQISDDPSVSDFDDCGFVTPGATNFLLDDLENCDYARTVQLCGENVLLDAGDNFDAYIWYIDENGDRLIDAGDTVITDGDSDNDPSTLLVSSTGTYIVDKQVADPCKGFQEIIIVEFFGATQSNPITALINDTSNTVEGNVLVCPNDGEELPEIFLCGLNDSELIQINIPDADSIVWEQLDETSCAAATPDCANTNNGCTWNNVGNGSDFLASDAGQYRLIINYQNGCFTRFYFNVFKNPLDPQFNSTDIVCNTPGNITVTNMPIDYEYQLVNASNNTIITPYSDNNGPSFTITNNGAYRVEMRQQGVVDGCVFILDNIGILRRDFAVDITTTDTNCNGLGEIAISVLDVNPQYYYEISQGGTTIDTFGPSNDNNYTFENLNDGTYDVLVTTDDGCSYSEQVTILDRTDLDLAAVLTKNIDCTDGVITVTGSGGFPNPDYNYAIWSYNGVDRYSGADDAAKVLNIPGPDYQVTSAFNFTNGEEGDYEFVVVDGNGCFHISNVVTIGVAPAVEYDPLTVTDENCFGAADGSVSINVTNSNGYSLSYELTYPDASTSTNASGSFTGLGQGNYSLRIIQTQGVVSCDFVETFTIGGPADLPSGTLALVQDYTCLQNGIIEAQNVLGGTAPYAYSIDGVNFIPDTTPNAHRFENLTDGTYSISIRDANGCVFVTNSIAIDPLNPPTDLTFATTALTCPALTSDVTVTVVDGNPNFTYEIIAPAAAVINNGNTNVFSGLDPGTYTFLATDAKGCTLQEDFTISPVDQISVVGQLNSNVDCLGGNNGDITFTVTDFVNSFDYAVTGPMTFNGAGETLGTIPLTTLIAGDYTIVVTDNDTNCTDTSTITVAAPPSALVISSLDVVDLTCSSSGTVPGSVAITATGGWGGYAYEIEDPSSTVTGPQGTNPFTGLTDTSGNYTVTVRDAGGCEVTQTFSLTPTVSPVLDLTANSLCYDSSIGLELTASVSSGGVAPFQYRLGSGAYQSNPIFTGLGPGSYTVEVIDSRNCTATAGITVFPTLNASASLVKDLDCSVSPDAEISLSITGGNPGFTYEVFLNGTPHQASTPVPSIPFSYLTTTPGTYTFTITDSESCTFTTNQVVVTDNPLPTVAPLVTDVRCNGESNGSVDLNISGGLAPYSIVFDGSAPSTQQVYSGLAAGTYTYTVTDSKNCMTTNTVTVNEPALLSLGTSITVDYTCDADATIEVTTTSGGTAPYMYSIDGVNFGPSTSFSGLTDGTHTITVRDANNCTATSAQTIAPLNPPTDLAFAQTALTCPTIVGDVTVSVTGGNTPFVYEIIAPAGSATNNGNNAIFMGLAPGTYTFRVTDSKNCAITEDYTVNPIPQVDAVSQLISNVSCVGGSDGAFNFTVSDFDTTYSYVVLDGLGGTVQSANTINTITPISVSGLGADTYVITITDDITNCTVTLNQTIAEPALALDFTFSNTDDTCIADATITVNATGGWGGYEYQLEDTTGPTVIYAYQSGNSFADVAPGTYTIYVRDARGCVHTRPITIDPAETPVIAFNPSDLCYDSTNQASLQVSVTDGVAPYSYTINGGGLIAAGGNPFTIGNLTPGTYNIQVTDAYGCVSNVITQTIEPQLIANAVLTQDLFCTANAVIDVTISGGYTPYASYQVQLNGGGYGATTAIAGNAFTYSGAAAAGTYQFQITDNNGCTVETNEIIVSPTVNPQAAAVVTNAACFGYADGSVVIDIDENFGVAPYTVSFDGSAFTATRTYSGLGAGTYPFIVRDSRGCEFTDDAIVGEPLQLLSNMVATDVTCNPATGATVPGSIDVTITQGGVPNFTYTLYDSSNTVIGTVVSASTTHTFNNLDFGDYYIRIIDANGCESDLGSVRVSSNPFLTLTANPTPPDCITGGSVDITASGGSGNYNFEIYNGGPGPTSEITTAPDTEVATFTSLNPGQTYIIRAEDVTNGCVSFLEVTIPPVSAISVVVDSTSDITCVGDDDGTMTFTVGNYDASVTTINWEILNALTNTAVTGPGTYTGSVGPGPAGGPQTATVTQIPPGDYVLVVREATAPSCTATATFRITEPSPVAVSLLSQLAANCNTDAEVTVRASGGTAGYSYAYVEDGNPAPVVFPEGQTFTLDPSVNLNWDIYAQDAAGCVSPPLDVTISVDASPEISSVIANECVTEGNFAINVTLTVAGTAPYRISVDGGAPQTTSWTNIGDVVTVSNLSSGNHTIQIVDANGCGELENITIFPPLEVIANITANENCDPANSGEVTITANGGSAAYTFTQTTPAGASNATGVFSGLTHSIAYTFQVADNNTGCIVPVTITLPAPVNPTFTLAKTDVSCFGGNDGTLTATLNPGNIDIPYLYSLDGGTTTQASNVFTGLTQGTYNVTVISTKGCSTTLPITIDEPSQLDITASASVFTCNDAVSTVTVGINNDAFGNPSGTAPYQYSFNGGAFGGGNTFAVAYGSPAVVVVVRDDNGCTDTVNVPIPVREDVTATITELQDIDCNNGQEIIQIIAANGSGNYSYTQLPSGSTVTDPTNIVITAPGTYVYEVTDTTTNCSFIVQHVVDPYDLINAVATVTSDATCSDATDGTIEVTVTGYTGTFDYIVLDNLGNPIAGTNDSDNATTDPYTFTVSTTLGAGTYAIRITETADPLCTTATNAVTIDAPQPLVLTLLDNLNANCNEANSIVTVLASGGTGPYTYGASQSGTGVPATFPFDSTVELNPLTATAWDIYVRDANGCIINTPLAVTIAADTTPDITLAIVDECAPEGNFAISVVLDAVNTGVGPYTMSLDGAAFQSITSFAHTYANLASGGHTVTIRDANGCGETENITISPQLTLSAMVNTQPSCNTADGIIDFVVAGGSGTNTVQLLRTDLTDTGLVPVGSQFTGVAFGNYIVRVTDATLGIPNCFVDVAISLEEPTAVTLLATGVTDVSCFGASDGSITVNLAPTGIGVNDNPPYTFEITDGTNTFTQNNGLFTGLPSGTYDITVTSNRNCVATDQVSIGEPTALFATITNVTPFACDMNNAQQSAQIEVTIPAGSGTPDYFYSVNGGSFLPTGGNVFVHSVNTSGNYDIVVRDANGCLFALPTQTIEPLNTFTAQVTQINPITCAAPNVEQIQITVNESAAPGDIYTFALLPLGNTSGVQTGSTATTADYDLTQPGNYVFRVTNTTTNCYVDTAPYTIAPYNTIAVMATPTAPSICFGDTNGALEIMVTGYTGGYDYEVFDPTGTSILTGTGNTSVNPFPIPGLTGGNYYVRVTETDLGSTFCSANSNTITIVSPDMMLDVTPREIASVTCTDDQGEIEVIPEGGYPPYDIVLTNTTTSQVYTANDVTGYVFTGLSAGTYDVLVTDDGGCPFSPPSLTLSIPNPIITDINASTGLLTCYRDDNASVWANLPVGGSGTYQYQLNVFANFGDLTPIFSTGLQPSNVFNNLGAGVYSITVSDGWNCDVTTPQVQIDEPQEVGANLIQTVQMRCTTNASLLLTATGGDTSGTYQYFDDMTATWINFNGGNSHTFNNIPPGDYQFMIRDANSCEAMISNQVSVDMVPPLTIAIDDTAAFINCTGEASATILARATGGLGNYSFELYDDLALTNLLSGPQSSNTFSGLPAGTYVVRVTSDDCEEVSEEIRIVDPAPLQIDQETSTDTSCAGIDDGTITVEVSGGTGEILYAITPNLNQFDSQHIFTDLAPGVYDVIAQDRNGCFIPFQFTIEAPEPLMGQAINILPEICAGSADGSFEVQITGGTAPYSTNLNSNDDVGFVQDQILFNGLASGTHVVFIRDAQGCEATVVAEINPGVNLNATVRPIYTCTGNIPENALEIVFEDASVSADVLYALDSTDPLDMQLTADFTNLLPGLHSLTIAHANGCMNTIDFEIVAFEPLVLALEQRNINEITAIASGGLEDYTFYFDDVANGTDNTIYINRTDTYTVRVVDQNGCEAMAEIFMEFIDIEIPNYFTPDGNGSNDFWVPENLEVFPNVLIIIFDRYGRELYRMGYGDQGWNGIYNNSELPTGDYWYVIKLKGENDDREFVGHFTLYR